MNRTASNKYEEAYEADFLALHDNFKSFRKGAGRGVSTVHASVTIHVSTIMSCGVSRELPHETHPSHVGQPIEHMHAMLKRYAHPVKFALEISMRSKCSMGCLIGHMHPI